MDKLRVEKEQLEAEMEEEKKKEEEATDLQIELKAYVRMLDAQQQPSKKRERFG